jgi:hypothetical protein
MRKRRRSGDRPRGPQERLGRYEDGKLVPLDVTKGDEVIFSKYGGTEVKVGGEEFLILRESDILAKVATTTTKAKTKAKA